MDNKLITKIKYSVGNSLERNINFNSSDQKLEELKNVSNQFESIFINQVLKQARQGKIADGILNSDAEETFNTMIDQEYSKILSEKSNFGIAEAIFDQFKTHVSAKRK
tara:strand:- start:57 stop:380 length:324 start_codon:yes stop_codon:yes gene_type:complete